MIPVVQRIAASGGVNGRPPGDCVKCCVASILEMAYEDVPHFVAGEWLVTVAGSPERVCWISALDNWLCVTGWALRVSRTNYHRPWPQDGSIASEFDLYDPLDRPRIVTPGMGYWIATVISENFERGTHAVVMLDGDVVHDPAIQQRRTPYQFVGEMHFIATDPARCRQVAGRTAP